MAAFVSLHQGKPLILLNVDAIRLVTPSTDLSCERGGNSSERWDGDQRGRVSGRNRGLTMKKQFPQLIQTRICSSCGRPVFEQLNAAPI
jgi:hypothetical protein